MNKKKKEKRIIACVLGFFVLLYIASLIYAINLRKGSFEYQEEESTKTITFAEPEQTSSSSSGSKKSNIVYLEVNNKKLTVKLEDNPAAKALYDKVRQGEVVVYAKEYGNFEKVGALGFTLPREDKNVTAYSGELALYQGDQLVLFYNSHSWHYTSLGRVTSVTPDQLKSILGYENVVMVLKKE